MFRYSTAPGIHFDGLPLAFGNSLIWQGADLEGAFLEGADLTRADLNGADLNGADLEGAGLRWADLTRADLNGADLNGVDLEGAGLRWADLTRADLASLQLQSAISLSGTILPDGSVCKQLPDADFFNEEKQAENRDACLAQAKAWNISG